MPVQALCRAACMLCTRTNNVTCAHYYRDPCAARVPQRGGLSGCVCAPHAQALYCAVWFLVYVDQGLLSSNGVTGTASTDPGDTGADAQMEGGLQASEPHCY